jgi:tRNA pseudouridine55 synthase
VKAAPHSIDGVIVIDKPRGLTSHDVVATARRALGERRIGHTGTLDPLATGVLPLACGRATRLVRFLTASDKEYDATIRFGLTTDTYDVTGAETSHSGRRPEAEAAARAVASLTGSYLQLPPAFSAKRVDGQRAYTMARRDQPVTLTPVPVTVTRADLVELRDDLGRVRLTCSAGCYVRSFVHSLGELVGTGACLQDLRRTRSGEFTLDQAIDVETLIRDTPVAQNAVISVDQLLTAFPVVTLTDSERNRVSHGQEVDVDVDRSSEWVRLMDRDGRLVALGRGGSRPGSLHPAVVLI